MQSSFRKYQWREALSLSLAKLTEGLVLKPCDIILEEIEILVDSKLQSEGSRITPQQLLTLISNNNLIPMAVKPHSIFFLCSEQNFKAACFDWLLSSVTQTKEVKVSMSSHKPGLDTDL